MWGEAFHNTESTPNSIIGRSGRYTTLFSTYIQHRDGLAGHSRFEDQAMSNRGIPLPPNLLVTLLSDSALNYAYNRCLTLEAQADMHQSKPPPLICARLLGYMLIHAPNNTGRHNVASDVGDCMDDAKLLELAQLYFFHFVRLCEYLLQCSVHCA
jgi:hypothetical protein